MARLDGVERPGFSWASVVFRAAKRKIGRVVRPLRIHALNPTVLRGYAFMEHAQEGADRVSSHLKKLAQLRVATRVGCPF